MNKYPVANLDELAENLKEQFSDYSNFVIRNNLNELTIRVTPDDLISIVTELKDNDKFSFDTLIDLCGVDYQEYGSGFESLFTKDAMHDNSNQHTHMFSSSGRFAVVIHLLSTTLNHRIRIRCFIPDDEIIICPSLTELYPCANWFEREAFDLFGIVFKGHNDLRRILTDYGFIGHPFRKDFPIYGTVEMRYDPDQKRVIYQPVSIEPREVVPRIRRRNDKAQ